MWAGFQEPASWCAEGSQLGNLRAIQLLLAVHQVHRITSISNELDAFHPVHGIPVEQRQDSSSEEGPQGAPGGYALNFQNFIYTPLIFLKGCIVPFSLKAAGSNVWALILKLK